MQRRLPSLFLALAVMLLGASAPLPPNAPSLVVFTLVPSGTVTIESTARIAAAIGIRVETEGGGIAVKSAPPDVKQSDYLAVARQLGVDYYMSGFVGPLGGGFSAALQLVAASSGIPVWTGTTTLSGTDDVEDIADAVATVIHNRSIAYAAIPLRTPEPAPTAAAAASEPLPPVARAPVGPASAEAPATAAPGPPVNPNAPSVAVLDAIGSTSGTTATSAEQLTYTSDAIALHLEKRGIVATRWHTQAPQIAVGGAALCEETKTGSLVEPTVDTETTSGMDTNGGNYSQVTVQLVSFNCTTHQVSRAVSGANGAFNWEWAADKSIADVAAHVPMPKAPSTK